MAGVSIRVDMSGLGRASRAFNELLARAEPTEPMMDEIGSMLVASTQARFESGRGPGGEPWKDTHRGGQILTDSGRLRDSITHQASGAEVRVGSNVIYAAVHQFGATIKPKSARALAFNIGSQLIFARQVTIPARPYLGVDAGDEAEIGAIVEDYLRGALE